MALYRCGGSIPLKTKSAGKWEAYPVTGQLEAQVDLDSTKKVRYIAYTAGGEANPNTITLFADGTQIFSEGGSNKHYGVYEANINARYIKIRCATSNWQTVGISVFYE